MLSLTANALPLTFAVSYLSCQIHSTKTGLEHDPRITREGVKYSILSNNKYLSIPSEQKKICRLRKFTDNLNSAARYIRHGQKHICCYCPEKARLHHPGFFHSPRRTVAHTIDSV